MKITDRIKEWASMSDGERVSMDRRAFLRGLAVTSAGLLVPAATVFDGGGRVVRVDPDFRLVGFSWIPEEQIVYPNKVRYVVREAPGIGLINPDSLKALPS